MRLSVATDYMVGEETRTAAAPPTNALVPAIEDCGCGSLEVDYM